MVCTACYIYLHRDVVIACVCAHTLNRLKDKVGPIAVNRYFCNTRFACIVFKPFYRFNRTTRKRFDITSFVKVDNFVCSYHVRDIFFHNVKFISNSTRITCIIRYSYNDTVETFYRRRKLAISYRYFRFGFAFHKVNLNIRRIFAREIRYGDCRKRIFRPYFAVFRICHFNLRNFNYANIRNVKCPCYTSILCPNNNLCCARKLSIRPVARERFNIKLQINPFVVFKAFNLGNGSAFRKTHIIVSVCTRNPNTHYKIIITRIVCHCLRGNESKLRPIARRRYFQNARFALVFSHPFRPRNLSNRLKAIHIRLFIKVNNFVFFYYVGCCRSKYVKIYTCLTRIAYVIGNRYLNTVNTFRIRGKFTISYRYFRFRFAFYKVYLHLGSIFAGEILHGDCR